MPERIIMHIDMNAFYASVEQAMNPRYRGKPVMVTMGPRVGIVATASYEAREYGIKTGMPVNQAYKLCPAGIFVQARMHLYMHISKEIFKIYQQYSPIVEYYSVDEAFIDYTGCERLFGPAVSAAKKIKAEIRSRFGITCSIGIASNKLLAKMAGELEKPDGLTVLKDRDIPAKIWTLPVKELFYVGRRTASKLNSWGMFTIGDIARSNPLFLQQKLGLIGQTLYSYANGHDDSVVLHQPPEAKGCGHSRTLNKNISDKDELRQHVYKLSCMVSQRLRYANQRGRTISVRIRYHDFYTRAGKSATFERYTNLESKIFKKAWDIFEEIWNGEAVRKIGIKVSNLRVCAEYEQLTLFNGRPEKEEKLDLLQDVLEAKYGRKVLVKGTLLNFSL